MAGGPTASCLHQEAASHRVGRTATALERPNSSRPRCQKRRPGPWPPWRPWARRQEPGAVPRSTGTRLRPTSATEAVSLSIPQKRVARHCGAPQHLHDGANQEACYARTVTCERQDSARMRALLRLRSGGFGLLWKGWDPHRRASRRARLVCQ